MSHRCRAGHGGCLTAPGSSCLANSETRKPGRSQAVCHVSIGSLSRSGGYCLYHSGLGGWKSCLRNPETRKPGTRRLRWLTAALHLARIARPGTHVQQRQVARTDSAVPLMLKQGADGAAPPNKSCELSATAARGNARPRCAPTADDRRVENGPVPLLQAHRRRPTGALPASTRRAPTGFCAWPGA
jgi:hypothetical protein